MAGIVPQNSSANRTIEVKSWDFWKWELNLFIKPDALISMQLQCLPMTSLLLALGNPTVNYLSLDLEGAELEVLSCLINQLTSWLVPTTVQISGNQDDTVRPVEYRGYLCGVQPSWQVGNLRNGKEGKMCFRIFPGSRALLHSHLDHAGFSYIGTLGGEKDEALSDDWNCCRKRRPLCSIQAAGGEIQVFERDSVCGWVAWVLLLGHWCPKICHHRKNTEKDSKRLLSLLHELSLIISQKRFNPEKSSLPLARSLSAQMWLSFFSHFLVTPSYLNMLILTLVN